MARLARFAIAIVLGPLACSTSDGASAERAPQLPADCSTNSVPLLLTFSNGVIANQLVAVRVDGRDTYLTVDTGSAATFLYGQEDHALDYRVDIGCETLHVMRRDFTATVFQGIPVVGVLGADFFREVPTELDYPNHKIVRHHADAPATTSDDVQVPVTDAAGHVAVRAEVDGIAHLLMVDTGSPHVVLAWTDGRPSDTKVAVEDITGAQLSAYLGDSSVALDTLPTPNAPKDEAKTLPVYRIPSWPYFEGYAKSLHPDLGGLYGRSAIGVRRVVFDTNAGVLRFGPLHAAPGS